MDMEHWNLLITQLEHLLDLDIFLHTTHQIQQMTGVDHPTFEPHMHTPEKSKDQREAGKTNQAVTNKSVNRMPVFSVKGQSSYVNFLVFASLHIMQVLLEQDMF